MNPTTQSLTVDQAIELALVHHRNNNLAAAETVYRQILAKIPEHAVAMHYLGVLMSQLGRREEALSLMTRSIELFPNQAGFYSNLGEVYRSAGQLDRAESAFRKAIELEPRGVHQHNNLGLTFLERGRTEEARDMLETALRLGPDDSGTMCNLAGALEKLGILDRACELLQHAIQINPSSDVAYTNLSGVLAAAGQLDAALQAADAALRLAPDDPQAHLMRAGALLKLGRLAEGWPEYEWRLRRYPHLVRQFSQPRWNGEDLQGRTILLYGEQGFGDALQFSRYAPLVKQKGGRVILECRAELKDLLSGVAGVDEVVTTFQPLPQFDVYCPLESLSGVFQTTLESIPANIPYLNADPARAEHWRNRLAAADGRLRVGLSWAGNPQHDRDRFRSCRLDDLAAVGQIEGVLFVTLQKGESSAQASRPPAGMRLIDVSNEIADFADLAGLISNLDLVISVDTAAAHLAGALGRQTWTLLSHSPEFRWMTGRTDSPWYPTMRLFRPSRVGDWPGVAHDVAEALRQRLATSS